MLDIPSEGSKPAGAYPYGCVNRWVNTWKQPFVQKPVLFLTAPPTPNIDKSESKIINIYSIHYIYLYIYIIIHLHFAYKFYLIKLEINIPLLFYFLSFKVIITGIVMKAKIKKTILTCINY